MFKAWFYLVKQSSTLFMHLPYDRGVKYKARGPILAWQRSNPAHFGKYEGVHQFWDF